MIGILYVSRILRNRIFNTNVTTENMTHGQKTEACRAVNFIYIFILKVEEESQGISFGTLVFFSEFH